MHRKNDRFGDIDLHHYTPEELSKFERQAVELPGTRKNDSETGIFRSALSPEELVCDYPKIKTVYDLLENTIATAPTNPCLGHRHVIGRDKQGAAVWSGYEWQDYKTVGERRLNFGAGCQFLYTEVVGGDALDKYNMGIYSINRPEWLIADWGADAYSNGTVALYDTLGPEASEYILHHAEIPICVTTEEKIPLLLRISPQLPHLKVLIVMKSLTSPETDPSKLQILKEWAAEKGVALYAFEEVEEIGKANPRPVRAPTPDDVWCICYTSGTTGVPKGALLTHRNALAVQRSNEPMLDIDDKSVECCYLPLAHVFERVTIVTVLGKGAGIGFSRGDVALLMEDFAALKPDFFPSVPRLLNRIHDKIIMGATGGSALKAGLFRMALNAKLENLKKGQMTHPVWDPLVFNKVKAVLGGRMKYLLSGSAPLGKDTMMFLRAVLGFQIAEGYGSTETTAGTAIQWAGDFSVGNVGPIIACSELKLVSVPEMGYHARENKGEIWVRGPNIFTGYLKEPEKTAEVLTEDGWYKTGDVGVVDEKGRLSIVDRKKNIFKLAQGEYCAPEKIENTYIRSNFVAQMYVHGDSLQSELVGIVVPDPEYAIQWAKETGLIPASAPAGTPLGPGVPMDPRVIDLCKEPKFQKAIAHDLKRLGKADKLRGFEFVKKIHLETEQWGVENDMMTPTFKLKRAEAAKKYRDIIDAMYKELNSQPVSDAEALKAKL